MTVSTPAEKMRSYRAANPLARVLDRWTVRTTGRALRRLAAEHPERFAALLEEERRLDPDPRLARRPGGTALGETEASA